MTQSLVFSEIAQGRIKRDTLQKGKQSSLLSSDNFETIFQRVGDSGRNVVAFLFLLLESFSNMFSFVLVRGFETSALGDTRFHAPKTPYFRFFYISLKNITALQKQ